jgi:hypothetical protein
MGRDVVAIRARVGLLTRASAGYKAIPHKHENHPYSDKPCLSTSGGEQLEMNPLYLLSN